MAKKLNPQIKQDRAELRERRTQLRQLDIAHRAAVKSHGKARAELETRIAIITGRLTK